MIHLLKEFLTFVETHYKTTEMGWVSINHKENKSKPLPIFDSNNIIMEFLIEKVKE